MPVLDCNVKLEMVVFHQVTSILFLSDRGQAPLGCVNTTESSFVENSIHNALSFERTTIMAKQWPLANNVS